MIKSRYIFLSIGAITVSASMVVAGIPYSEEQKASFITAMVSAGCHVDVSNAAGIKAATGLSDDLLNSISHDLRKADLYVFDENGEGATLIHKGCP